MAESDSIGAFDSLELTSLKELPEPENPPWPRPKGEYVRPAECLELDAYCTPLSPNFLRGVQYMQPALRRLTPDTLLRAELVPEPHNPHDHQAVAVDVDGSRVGYLAASFARVLHDVIVAWNKAGYSVAAPARAEAVRMDSGVVIMGLEIYLPDWQTICLLATASDIYREHRLVLQRIGARDTQRLISQAWDGLTPASVRLLHQYRDIAPSLTWAPPRRGERLVAPYWHVAFLRNDAILVREHRRVLKTFRFLAKKEVRRRERAQARYEAEARREQDRAKRAARQSEQRRELAEQVLRLHTQGMTHRQIAESTGVALSRIGFLLKGPSESGVGTAAANGNEQAALYRVERCLQAERLRGAGSSHADIAKALGCAVGSVKDLVSAGRFYLKPDSAPERRNLAERFANLRQDGATAAEAMAALGTSKASADRARTDAAALASLRQGYASGAPVGATGDGGGLGTGR